MPPATDEDYPAAPSTPLRIYGSWDDENKENIDPKWGPKTGGDPSKRGTRTLRKLRKTKLADAASNVVANAGNVGEAGSPRSVLDFNASGLAHRDVKPSNMLLELGHDGRYHLKLCDLGMARFSPHAGPRANKFVTLGAGTPAYSPPESYRPAPLGRPGPPHTPTGWRPEDAPGSPAAEIDDLSKWDIYSFATVIWYSWYCADPFAGLSVPEVCVAVARGERPAFEVDDDVPDNLIALVDAMWHQLPARRPSAHHVLAALQSDDLVKEILHIAFKQDKENTPLLPA